MADTKRTSTDLITNLFQDGQAAGSITPGDLRDFIVSVQPPFGHAYISASAATTISVAGTYYKAAGTTTLSATVEEVSDGSVNNRLVYTGTPDRHFHIVATVSMTAASNNQIIGLKLAKNGTVLDESVTRRAVSTGADVGSTAIHADAMMSTNDYIELFVTNETSTASVTVTNMYLFMMGMLV